MEGNLEPQALVVSFEESWEKVDLEEDIDANHESDLIDALSSAQLHVDSGSSNMDAYSALIFNIGGQQLGAHQAVLANGSSFFRSQFGPRNRADKEQVHHVQDFAFDTIKSMLRFIYTKRFTTDPEPDYSELLKAAAFYGVDELKEACEKKQASRLANKNAIQCLVASDELQAKVLMAASLDFVAKNEDQLRGTDEWEQVSLDLVLRVVRKLSRKPESGID